MISQQHKCIFIHIHRTGGTSIEAFFNQPRQKHYTIHHYLKNPECQDMFKFTFVRNPWTKVVNHYRWRQEKKYKNWNLDGPLGVTFPVWLQHLYDTFKINKDKTDIYPSKVRDAHHLKPYGMNLIPQLNWISNQKGDLLVDFIGRFERLQQDFNLVCSKLGIKKTRLPWINKTEHKPYHEYYNQERIEMVAEIYSKDIEYFGFQFNKGVTLL